MNKYFCIFAIIVLFHSAHSYSQALYPFNVNGLLPIEIVYSGERMDNYSRDPNILENAFKFYENAMINSQSDQASPQEVAEWYTKISKEGRKYDISYIFSRDRDKYKIVLHTPPKTKMLQEMIREEILTENRLFLVFPLQERISLTDRETVKIARDDFFQYNFDSILLTYPFLNIPIGENQISDYLNNMSIIEHTDNSSLAANNEIYSIIDNEWKYATRTCVVQKNLTDYLDHVWLYEGRDFREHNGVFIPYEITITKMYKLKAGFKEEDITFNCPYLLASHALDIKYLSSELVEPLCVSKWSLKVESVKINKAFLEDTFWPKVPSDWMFKDSRSFYDESRLFLETDQRRGVGPHEFIQ